LSAIFVPGVPDPTLEKVGSENFVRERCLVIVRVFVSLPVNYNDCKKLKMQQQGS
jgi:hypothetical protein